MISSQEFFLWSLYLSSCPSHYIKYFVVKECGPVKGRSSGQQGPKSSLWPIMREMANYICPNNYLSVENHRQFFEIIIRSNPLPSNRGVIQHCNSGFGEIMNNIHVFQCSVLNQDKLNIYYIEILTNGSLKKWNYLWTFGKRTWTSLR